MKVINGYKLLDDFQTRNAGFSQYTFAEKNGKQYFIKKLLDPVYPDKDKVKPELLADKIRGCREYERNQKILFTRYNAASDGNMVFVEEFFRDSTHYYLTMPRIENEVEQEEIMKLSYEDRLLFCLCLMHSLMKLHEAKLIHGDLKRTNVLPVRTSGGKIVGKIIDVDGCRIEGMELTEDEELGGDQLYIAPEVLKCMFEPGEPITCKADVFSAGLMIHEYMTGVLPEYDAEFDYAAEALLNDGTLTLDENIESGIRSLIEGMLQTDPEKRISSLEAYTKMHKEFTAYKYRRSERPAPEKGAEREPETKARTGSAGWFSKAGDL